MWLRLGYVQNRSENPCTAIFRTGLAKAAGMDTAANYTALQLIAQMGNPDLVGTS
jgi:hypothetical protein